jgi:hypothetical protein
MRDRAQVWLEHREHGGGCCGISHISEFAYEEEDEVPDYKGEEEDIARMLADGPRTHLFEIVLAGTQIKNRRAMLKRLGFREVTRFRNSNSGNICYVFHHVSGDGPLKKGRAK